MWIMLLVQWNGHEPGEVLKINYPTGADMVEKGFAIECEPPQGAITKREKAVLGPHEKR